MRNIYIFFILISTYNLSYGQLGNSLNFDGTNDRVDIGNVIPNASSYTKEAMINTNNIQWKNIVTSDPCPFWFGGGKLQAGHGTFDNVAVDASSLLGKWAHVAVTYDAPSTTMKLYIDGVKVDENNSVAAYQAGDIQIGAYKSGYFFDGDMDEVRIWDYARSETEINEHKDSELVVGESGLLAYYQFNQGIAGANNSAITSLTDNSFNSNDGTLVGFALNGSSSNWIDASPILSGLGYGALEWEGGPYTLDGISQWETVPSDILKSTTNFTISTWVKADTLQTGTRIFDFGNSTTSYMYLTGKGTNNNIEFGITNTGSAGEQYISGTSNEPLPINAWQHITVVQNGTIGILYLNGVEIGRNSDLTLNTSDLSGLSTNYIGKARNNDLFLDGQIDEFKVFDTALGEIAKILINIEKPTVSSPIDSWIIVSTDPAKTLKWNIGKYFTSTNVYLGDSYDAVSSSTTPLDSGLVLGTNSVAVPTDLSEGEVYYWRVDEVNGSEVRKGDVWKFKYIGGKVKVFLMGGQSNMVGWTPLSDISDDYKHDYTDAIVWADGQISQNLARNWMPLTSGMGRTQGHFGPELSFGPEIARLLPGENIALLKCSWGGTSLYQRWRPPSSGGTTGDLYTNFVKSVKDGLAAFPAGLEPEIVGMLWMQGEDDAGNNSSQAHADEYESNLTNLIRDIRAEVNLPKMPFVIGQIGSAPAWNYYGATVKAAQLAVGQNDANASTILTNDYGLSDPWHYNGAGVLSLGIRFAGAMDALLDNALGIDDLSGSKTNIMYPNPVDTNGKLHFEFGNSVNEKKTIQIIDLQGKVLYKKETSDNHFTLNTSGTIKQQGLYLVTIETEQKTKSFKLIAK